MCLLVPGVYVIKIIDFHVQIMFPYAEKTRHFPGLSCENMTVCNSEMLTGFCFIKTYLPDHICDL